MDIFWNCTLPGFISAESCQLSLEENKNQLKSLVENYAKWKIYPSGVSLSFELGGTKGQRSASMMAAFSSAPHFLVVYVVFIDFRTIVILDIYQ